jgi:hypothetical protein
VGRRLTTTDDPRSVSGPPIHLATQTMKYKLNRQKFGKAPMSILPALLACLEYDSSSPYFELVRCYMRPNTPEERWAVLEADVKEAYAKLEAAQNASFNQKIDRIVARLKRMELRGKSCD